MIASPKPGHSCISAHPSTMSESRLTPRLLWWAPDGHIVAVEVNFPS